MAFSSLLASRRILIAWLQCGWLQLDRLIATGLFPKPDLKLDSGRPRWRYNTLKLWFDRRTTLKTVWPRTKAIIPLEHLTMESLMTQLTARKEAIDRNKVSLHRPKNPFAGLTQEQIDRGVAFLEESIEDDLIAKHASGKRSRQVFTVEHPAKRKTRIRRVL